MPATPSCPAPPPSTGGRRFHAQVDPHRRRRPDRPGRAAGRDCTDDRPQARRAGTCGAGCQRGPAGRHGGRSRRPAAGRRADHRQRAATGQRTTPVAGAATSISTVGGKVPVQDIAEGSAISSSALAQGFSLQLRTGERALAVPVDELVGAGNRILPGDFVDVRACCCRA
ncbi:hypothetical protein G6F32_014530 [Rhizopus arrhizus]|nr:hypothetical protein G6F32_014530 [Rhizopus arrhizus]